MWLPLIESWIEVLPDIVFDVYKTMSGNTLIHDSINGNHTKKSHIKKLENIKYWGEAVYLSKKTRALIYVVKYNLLFL